MKNIYNVALQAVIHAFVGLAAMTLAGVLAYQLYPAVLPLAALAIVFVAALFVVITWVMYLRATWGETYL